MAFVLTVFSQFDQTILFNQAPTLISLHCKSAVLYLCGPCLCVLCYCRSFTSFTHWPQHWLHFHPHSFICTFLDRALLLFRLTDLGSGIFLSLPLTCALDRAIFSVKDIEVLFYSSSCEDQPSVRIHKITSIRLSIT